MALTPEEIVVYTARLAEAEAAYHQVMIGHSITVQRHDGRHVEYSSVNRDSLQAYIAWLRAQIAGTPRARRTFRVTQTGNGLV